MDWTQFFNPSSFGSFAPSMMSPAANAMAPASGAPAPGGAAPVGRGAMTLPTPMAQNPQGSNLFNAGMRMMQPQQTQPPPMQLHFPTPVGPGRMGMLG
jgi:hypothetical protein